MSGHFGHPGTVVGSCSSVLEHVAKDIEADRLNFHEVPSFDPRPFLDDRNRAQFERPLDYAVSRDSLHQPVPSVRLRCSKAEQKKLMEKLDACQRLALLPISSVRAGLESGMFSVPNPEYALLKRFNKEPSFQ